MIIFGKQISKKELLTKIGDLTQIGGMKLYEFIDGLSNGVRAVDVKTVCGLDLTVILDRCMDISNLSYKSIPISWRSATKETSPIYYESNGDNLLRTFFGGLVTTCGLTQIGEPCIDDGEELGLHGRISNIGAESIWVDGKWEEDEYIMWVQGKVRQMKVNGEKLLLTRKITTYMFKPKIILEDTIENIGFEISPLMVLYHINIGYPIVDSGSRLIEGKAKVTPRNQEAEKDFKDYNTFSGPKIGFKEQVYYHDIEADNDGNSNIALVNENFRNNGLGIGIKFNKDNLPLLVQWKQMGFGEYVCGVEPSNCFVEGRKIEKERGNLKYIEPGEIKKFKLEFDILKSNKDINLFKEINNILE